MSMIGTVHRVPDTRLKALLGHSEDIEEFFEFEQENQSNMHDLDKAWHGLQFLMTGTAWEGTPPLDFLVRGGQELDSDMGYGPPRAFSHAEVQALVRALASLTNEDLTKNFDAPAMTKASVYPSIWDRTEERDETLAWLLQAFAELRTFVTSAADAGDALLVYLS